MLVLAIGTQGATRTAGRGITRFLHNLPRKKRVRRLHARIENGHDSTGAVEPAIPRRIRTDKRHALRKRRRVQVVSDHAPDPERRRFQLGNRVGADIQRHKRHRLVSVNESMRSSRESAQYLAARSGDIAPLSADRMSRKQPLGDVVASRRAKLDEDTSVPVSTQTVMDLLRDDRAWLRSGGQTPPDDTDRERDKCDDEQATRLAVNRIAQRPGLWQKVRFLSTIPWRLCLTMR